MKGAVVNSDMCVNKKNSDTCVWSVSIPPFDSGPASLLPCVSLRRLRAWAADTLIASPSTATLRPRRIHSVPSTTSPAVRTKNASLALAVEASVLFMIRILIASSRNAFPCNLRES